jgi:Flp pilus assembly protein TadB
VSLVVLHLLAALSSGTSLLLLVPPPARWQRLRAPRQAHDDERALLLRVRPVLVVLAFVGGWTFVGGPVGVLAGAAGGVFAWRVLGHAESPSARRRREELERDLPTAVHLLGACLTAGAATGRALETVAAALPGAVADELLLVRHRLALGADPVTVWRGVAAHQQLGPLGRSLSRAHQSGASVRDAVENLAADLSAGSRARTDALARSVDVRAAAPLGVCFLPAFLLLGVVPMVAGVFSSMHLFG